MLIRWIPILARYIKQNERRRVWRKIVSALACVVVFCTTYALMLPAITMERPTVCEMEEHVHDVSCYQVAASEEKTSLRCVFALLESGAESQGETGSLLGDSGSVMLHTHRDHCLDENGDLVCPLEEIEAHTHDDSCYSEPEAHTHTDSCYTVSRGAQTCTLEETEGHTHGDACRETNLACTISTEPAHTHGEGCWRYDLTCTEDEIAPYSYEEEVSDTVLSCTNTDEGHEHDEACYQTTTGTRTVEVEGHTHGEDCYEAVLTCELPTDAHAHGDSCYETKTVCTIEETKGHAHVDACYERITTLTCGIQEGTVLGEPELTCTKEELELHTHSEDKCYTVYTDDSGDQHTVLTCEKQAVREHDHGEMCFVTEQIEVDPEALTCTLEETEGHTHSDACLDESGQTVCGLEETSGHTHNELCYGKWELICELEAHTHVESCYAELTQEQLQQIQAVIDAIDALPSAEEIEEKIAEFEEAGDTEGEEAWLTEVYQQVRDVYQMYAALGEELQPYVTNADKLLELEYIWSPTTLAVDFWKKPTVVQGVSTSDFIELNLYDYGSNINEKYNDITFTYGGYDGVKLWPGFQWNGGAYKLNNTFHRHQVDYIDFGNSVITDLEYGSSSTSYSYGKAENSVSVGKLYTYNSASQTGIINRLWWDESDNGSITNRPIGMSMNSSTTDTTYDVLKPILTPGGYPVILSSDEVSGFGGVMDYLFSDNAYATKKNTTSIDGLFQIDPETGGYYYNSRWNHAQYSNNKFTLYKEVITPNFIVYPFGNFLPLNSITDSNTSTNIGMVDHINLYLGGDTLGGLNAKEAAGTALTTSESQLREMLNLYKADLESVNVKDSSGNILGSAWTQWSALNAIQDYFWGDAGSSDDAPAQNTTSIIDRVNEGLYNIDFDVPTNFFFGMDMSMRFYQPKNGKTGYDNNNDGTPDYDMKFYFTGDDDVWVFIDGNLFLDLTGIHRHVGGEIDFVNGVVNYYELDVPGSGDVKTTPYRTFTFKDLVTKAVKFRKRNDSSYTDANAAADVAEIINPSTGRFYDYSIHEFKFFYMERGSGSSVCRLNFNFPLLRQNTLSVSKELSDDSADIVALGNPDFTFQVLDVDDNGNKTENSFFAQYDEAGSQWAYSLYDVDGSLIQEVKVTEKNPDGTVKSLEVYQGGKLVRKEYQDTDGNVIIDNYPENGTVLTVDENGCFTLKAGQRAEFVGIPESWGKYYVRELLPDIDSDQYETIYVSGVATDKETTTVGGITFQGVESPVLDMTNGSSTFNFENKITTKKLGDLSIKKAVPEGIVLPEDKTFDMEVKLDGVLLPVGTSYTVSDGTTTETKTVATAGLISLKAGQTATIANILSGTQFEVKETDGSAEGYVVESNFEVHDDAGTKVEDPADIKTITNGVSGIIRNSTRVSVVITNTPNEAKVEIPGTKTVGNGALDTTTERTYTFTLTQVADAQGTAMEAPFRQEQSVTVTGTEEKSFAFEIPYAHTSQPGTYYYMITENAPAAADVSADQTVYIAQVEVTKAENGLISAKLTSLTKSDGTTAENAAFVNTLTGELSLTKLVDGSEAAKQNAAFNFTVILTDGNGAPLSGKYSVTAYNQTVEPVSWTTQFDESGTHTFNEFHHNETLVIHGLPLGTKWTIREVSADGYIVSWTIDGTPMVGTDNGVSGDLNANVQVVCTNTTTYSLPETGGVGTNTYTMAGLMLMLFSLAFLLYRSTKRRRGAS